MKDDPATLSGGGVSSDDRVDAIGHILYTVSMFTTTGPLSATQVAGLAWEMTAEDLQKVVPPGAPSGVLEEIRAQFAAWCSARPLSLFADIEAAWNEFTRPRHNLPGPAVLLPGTACPECAHLRLQREEFHRVSFAGCARCAGTGRLRPRAIPTRVVTAGTFSGSYTQGHETDALSSEAAGLSLGDR